MYKCVCKQFSERLYSDLISHITKHVQSLSCQLQTSVSIASYDIKIHCFLPVYVISFFLTIVICLFFFFFANLLRFFFLFLISHSCLTHVLHLNLFLVTVFFFGSSLVFFFVCLILNKYLVLSVQVIFCQHGFFTLKKRICIKITGGNAD